MARRLRPQTVTLYNYTGTVDGDMQFQRTVLGRVALNMAYQQALSMRGVTTTDNAQLIIDLRDVEANRAFIPYHDWMATKDKERYFTFAQDKDFFVEGATDDNLPPLTKQQMQGRHQAFSVKSCTIAATDDNKPCILVVTGA